MNRFLIEVRGIVQGVGFRPFIYNFANKLNLKGYVKNTADGVVIEAEGERADEFIEAIKNKYPPLARIDSISVERLPPGGYEKFSIVESADSGSFTLVSPDISVCGDCLRELFDPADRRYLYPFINCTNCGPRYSITKSVPYDRPNTTMSPFKMCPQCAAEYGDPANRRFHAQPNACSDCGPRLEFKIQNSKLKTDNQAAPAAAAIDLLKQGAIVAVKGIGGFHLCCDALNEDAVKRLREKKRRSNKPFALMSPGIESIRRFCHISGEEGTLLRSSRRPVVLLEKKAGSKSASRIFGAVAPNNKCLGFMLPYTPLHYLLFYSNSLSPVDRHFGALVMTSGNLSEEPIVTDNDGALEKLSHIADAFLLHDRDIFMRVDDSVVKARSGGRRRKSDSHDAKNSMEGNTSFIRRARGFVPETIMLEKGGPDVLGCGADIKNTFTLTKGSHAVVSQHIGDMENYETLAFFEETLNNLKQVYRAEPEAIAYDLHPSYMSSRWAIEYIRRTGIMGCGIQHHYAHIASVMAENGIKDRVIGIAFDGSGYGTDGSLWGGEFLVCDMQGFTRAAHFKYIPLPGGQSAIRECWRTAVSYVLNSVENNGEHDPEEFRECMDSTGFAEKYGRRKIESILKIINDRQFSPLSSGAGRLFDAVAALTGICDMNTFEGEAAIALESIIKKDTGNRGRLPAPESTYPFDMFDAPNAPPPSFAGVSASPPVVIDFSKTILNICGDIKSRADKSSVAVKFHDTLIAAIKDAAVLISRKYGIRKIALSGGVFQNSYILEGSFNELLSSGFEVYTNENVPCNDACISLGQAYIARERLKNYV